MWLRLPGRQTATTKSNHYISLIPSFRHENMKLWVTYDTGHSSPECAALIRWMRRLQWGADIFPHLCLHFSSEPFIIFAVDAFLSLHPASPSLLSDQPWLTLRPIHHPVCVLACSAEDAGWRVGFFPAPDLFFRVNTGRPFCDSIEWLVPLLQQAS